MVYAGTHDNDTIQGWMKHASRKERAFAKDYLRPAVAGGLVPVGDGVIGVEPPEVVDAQGVVELELEGDAPQPPGVALLLHLLPVEQRVRGTIWPDGWLEDYALFMALKNKFGGASWLEWPEDIRQTRPDRAPQLKLAPPAQPGDSEAQHVKAVLVEEGVVHPLRGAPPVQALIFLWLQQAPIGQEVQVDEVGVAREGGEGLIGGVLPGWSGRRISACAGPKRWPRPGRSSVGRLRSGSTCSG